MLLRSGRLRGRKAAGMWPWGWGFAVFIRYRLALAAACVWALGLSEPWFSHLPSGNSFQKVCCLSLRLKWWHVVDV